MKAYICKEHKPLTPKQIYAHTLKNILFQDKDIQAKQCFLILEMLSAIYSEDVPDNNVGE